MQVVNSMQFPGQKGPTRDTVAKAQFRDGWEPYPSPIKIREEWAKWLSADFKFPVCYNFWYHFGAGTLHALVDSTNFPG